MSDETKDSARGDIGCAAVLITLIISVAAYLAYLHHDENITERACIAAGGSMFAGHCDANKQDAGGKR